MSSIKPSEPPTLTEQPAPSASYDPFYFAPLFAAEDRHFWFRARNRIIETLVEQITAHLPSGYRALEVGCGTGNVLRVLERACPKGTVVGMDLWSAGLRYARQRATCPLVQGDMHAPPFHTQFALVGLFDVLEHLPDDLQVLRDLHALLAADGALLLTVPAHSWLWSYFDEAGHHCRRYERGELEEKLAATGYRVEYITEYLASILPWVWLRRWRLGLNRHVIGRETEVTHDLVTDELRIVPIVNALLAFVLTQEARLIQRRRVLPIGTAIVALARADGSARPSGLADPPAARC